MTLDDLRDDPDDPFDIDDDEGDLVEAVCLLDEVREFLDLMMDIRLSKDLRDKLINLATDVDALLNDYDLREMGGDD